LNFLGGSSHLCKLLKDVITSSMQNPNHCSRGLLLSFTFGLAHTHRKFEMCTIVTTSITATMIIAIARIRAQSIYSAETHIRIMRSGHRFGGNRGGGGGDRGGRSRGERQHIFLAVVLEKIDDIRDRILRGGRQIIGFTSELRSKQ
jgi:hypothetical protein